MKITKTNKEYLNEIQRKKSANKGCKVCPCCGENKTWEHYMKKGKLDKGILAGGMVRSWAEGFFKTRIMSVDYYKCITCGAEWESEPYER